MSALKLQRAGVSISGRALLKDVSLELQPGSVSAVVGPNGAGKTTLLRLLGGIWRPSQGEVLLDGKPLASFPRREVAKRISYVPQQSARTFEFTVRELVAMGRYPHEPQIKAPTRDDARIVEECMRRVDVAHLQDRMVTELSGGEMQRVILARALATRAEIILFDEPTSNLDLSHAIEVLELCGSLAKEGKTLAVALHDLNAAQRFADHCIVLDRGRVAALGPAPRVLTPERITEVFRVQSEILKAQDGSTLYYFRAIDTHSTDSEENECEG